MTDKTLCPHCLDGKNVYHGDYTVTDPDCEHCNGTGYKPIIADLEESRQNWMDTAERLEKVRDELRNALDIAQSVGRCQHDKADALRRCIKAKDEAMQRISNEYPAARVSDLLVNVIAIQPEGENDERTERTESDSNSGREDTLDATTGDERRESKEESDTNQSELPDPERVVGVGGNSAESDSGDAEVADDAPLIKWTYHLDDSTVDPHLYAIMKSDGEYLGTADRVAHFYAHDAKYICAAVNEELPPSPPHKCQNNIDAVTGECAVCGGDTPEKTFNADWMIAPSDAPPEDAPKTRECPRCGNVMGLLKAEKSEDAPMGKPSDAPTDAQIDAGVKMWEECLEESDVIQRLQQQIAELVPIGAELAVEREKREELEKRVVLLYDAIGLSIDEPDYSVIDQLVGATNEMDEKLTAIESRLAGEGKIVYDSNAPSDALAVGETPDGWDADCTALQIKPPSDAPIKRMPTSGIPDLMNPHDDCLNNHADAIQRLQEAERQRIAAWQVYEPMIRQWRERLQQQIDAETTARMDLQLHVDSLKDALNAEREKREGFQQQIDDLIDKTDTINTGKDKSLERLERLLHLRCDEARNRIDDLIASRTVDPAAVDHDTHAEQHRDWRENAAKDRKWIAELGRRITAIESRLAGEGDVPNDVIRKNIGRASCIDIDKVAAKVDWLLAAERRRRSE